MFLIRLPLFLFNFTVFLILTLLGAMLSFLPKQLHGQWFFRLYRLWSLSFVNIFGLKKHIHYHSEKPLPDHFILISNHPTGIDVIWLPGQFNVVPLSKQEIAHWPVIGNITRAAGIVFVNRDEARSRSNSLVSCINEVKAGKNILIFPEGGCLGKRLHPFKNGAFDIACKTGIPVLPAYLYYEEEDTYELGEIGAFQYITRLLLKPKNRNAHLHIFEPINPAGFESTVALKQYTFNFYKELEQKYSRQI